MRKGRLTVSLPSDMLRDVDRERLRTRESRSEFVRRAVEHLMRHSRERDAVDRYVAGYVLSRRP